MIDDAMRDANEWHDSQCRRWRRNGRTKLWKRSPQRWQVPVKYGLYSYDYVDDVLAREGRIHLEGTVDWCKASVPFNPPSNHVVVID